MIDLNYIKAFFPQQIRAQGGREKYMLKEYIQLSILDFLSTRGYVSKLVFIGGTNLRLVKGIDRFSEDLDFDCKNLSKDEFMRMTDDVLIFLKHQGQEVETRDRENPRLTAYRRNLYFPRLLFELGLTGHQEERFLVKIEAQDQGVRYQQKSVNIRGCGYFFPIQVPTDNVLLSMKLSALLSRAKGRDFYDTMFLWQQTQPDFDFLRSRTGIGDIQTLKVALNKCMDSVDLMQKKHDFEHLLFNPSSAERILHFREFVNQMTNE